MAEPEAPQAALAEHGAQAEKPGSTEANTAPDLAEAETQIAASASDAAKEEKNEADKDDDGLGLENAAGQDEPLLLQTKTSEEEPTTVSSSTDAIASPISVGESFDASLNSPPVGASYIVESASEEQSHDDNNNNNKNDTETIPNDATGEEQQRGIKVLFLSSDTGGGHRASAESLANQFQLLFPGSTYDLLDVVGEDFGPPYNSLVSVYKHLSAHPSQWKLLYTISNSRGFEMIADAHFKLMFERAIRKRLKKYNPDVVVSVHPMMTNVPVLSCKRISNETGRHLPMFTVVTDLGSAHCLWFANGVEKMFVGSEQVKALAKARGKVPDEKLVLSGLPIRHDFAVQAQNMGERFSVEGKTYQAQVRANLQLPYTHRKTLLLMGGGEGVGSLSSIVDALYVELVSQGIDALVLVVCGRNEKLKHSLETRDWKQVFRTWQSTKNRDGVSKRLMSFGDGCGTGISTTGCIESGTVTGSIRRMLSTGKLTVGNMMATPDPVALPHAPDEKKADDVTDKEGDHTAASYDVDLAETAPSPASRPQHAEETVTPEHAGQEGDASAELAAIAASSQLPGEAVDEVHDDIKITESDVSFSSLNENTKAAADVHVMGLGFVTKMAEYMVAADVLVTKAGPGTISEAAALSLPVMLTSFLPGQEEGNVDYVIDGGFGAFVNDSDPIGIAEEICMWLTDDERRAKLSEAAKAHGAPYAARDIVKQIGDSTLKWREINEEKDRMDAATAAAAEDAKQDETKS